MILGTNFCYFSVFISVMAFRTMLSKLYIFSLILTNMISLSPPSLALSISSLISAIFFYFSSFSLSLICLFCSLF